MLWRMDHGHNTCLNLKQMEVPLYNCGSDIKTNNVNFLKAFFNMEESIKYECVYIKYVIKQVIIPSL